MKIAIIGTGGIGAGLASVLAKAAHEITVSDRKGGTKAAAKLAGLGLSVRAAEVRPAVAAADNARHIEPLAYLNIQFGYMLGQGTQTAPVWLSR